MEKEMGNRRQDKRSRKVYGVIYTPITINMTEEEKAEFAAAASSVDRSLSNFGKKACLEAARKINSKKKGKK